MFSCKREHVEAWTAKQFPDDRVVSYMLSMIYSASYSAPQSSARELPLQSGTFRLGDVVEKLGLDRELVVGRGYGNTFYVLTDQRLCLGSRSAFLNKPKLLLHSSPLDGVRMHWFDSDTGAGNTFRHQIIEFGDGHWRADRSGLTALGWKVKANNTEHFIESMGSRAVKVEND